MADVLKIRPDYNAVAIFIQLFISIITFINVCTAFISSAMQDKMKYYVDLIQPAQKHNHRNSCHKCK